MRAGPTILAGLMLVTAGVGCANRPAPVVPPTPLRPAAMNAIDPKFRAYGDYLQKLSTEVQAEWERILIDSQIYPAVGSNVTVTFRLDRQGRVAEIISVEGSAGTPAEKACVAAITSKAPYGLWTEPMVAVLGDSQELTFWFYYQ